MKELSETNTILNEKFYEKIEYKNKKMRKLIRTNGNWVKDRMCYSYSKKIVKIEYLRRFKMLSKIVKQGSSKKFLRLCLNSRKLFLFCGIFLAQSHYLCLLSWKVNFSSTEDQVRFFFFFYPPIIPISNYPSFDHYKHFLPSPSISF